MITFDHATERPWRVEESTGAMDANAKYETGSRVLIYSDDCEYHPVADCSCNHTCRMPDKQEANAALIVAAVNSYHATTARIAALEGALKAARYWVSRTVVNDADMNAAKMARSDLFAIDAALASTDSMKGQDNG